MSTPELLSLVLTLRPQREASLPPRLGRAAHALLLAKVRAHDPELATYLHNGEGPKPFTVSNMMGTRREGRVLPAQRYTLRYTALTAQMAEILGKAFSVGEVITFEGVPLTVEAVDDGEGTSPWSGRARYEMLAAHTLLPPNGDVPLYWTLLLASPTAFQSQDKTRPFPMPSLVFGSLVTRWNAFAPIRLPEEGIRHYAEEMVAVSRFSLRSLPGWDRNTSSRRGLRIGAVGRVTYRALNRDRYWRSVLTLLAGFALYAGVGTMTTMGMGQVRWVM